MELGIQEALTLTVLLIAVAVALQSTEMLLLRKDYWPWKTIRRDYAFLPGWIVKGMDFTLAERNFFYLHVARLVVAVLFFFFPGFWFSLFLFLTTILTCLRFRGSFNGGSDFMTLIVLLGTTLALAFPGQPLILFFVLWYVAIQSCSSYFIGGFVKLKRASWRNGSALVGFLGSTIYRDTAFTEWLRNRRILTFIAAWSAIMFELSFPLLVFTAPLTLLALVLGLLFHQLNAHLFGLNRFFFAWAASYPAIYYCSQSLTHSF